MTLSNSDIPEEEGQVSATRNAIDCADAAVQTGRRALRVRRELTSNERSELRLACEIVETKTLKLRLGLPCRASARVAVYESIRDLMQILDRSAARGAATSSR